MDVTPLIPADRQVIDSYGANGFHVSGVAYQGAILVFAEKTQDWAVAGFADISAESLRPVIDHGGIEILLIGCGKRMQPVPMAVRRALKEAGIVVDAMDTGAACRTYNILLAEERRVAVALLPPG